MTEPMNPQHRADMRAICADPCWPASFAVVAHRMSDGSWCLYSYAIPEISDDYAMIGLGDLPAGSSLGRSPMEALTTAMSLARSSDEVARMLQ